MASTVLVMEAIIEQSSEDLLEEQQTQINTSVPVEDSNNIVDIQQNDIESVPEVLKQVNEEQIAEVQEKTKQDEHDDLNITDDTPEIDSKSKKRRSFFRKSKRNKKNKENVPTVDSTVTNEAENVESDDKMNTSNDDTRNDSNVSTEAEDLENLTNKKSDVKQKPRKKGWKRMSWHNKNDEVVNTENAIKATNDIKNEENDDSQNNDGSNAENTSQEVTIDENVSKADQNGGKSTKKKLWKRMSWKEGKEEIVASSNGGNDSVEINIPTESKIENEESKGFKRSFVKKIRKRSSNKLSGSYNSEKKKTENLDSVDGSCENDSFHDVFNDKDTILESNTQANGEDIAVVINSGIYIGDDVKEEAKVQQSETQSDDMEKLNESQESDLTIVTALPDASIEVTTQTTSDAPIQCTSSQADNDIVPPDAKEIAEDPMEISKEEILPEEVNTDSKETDLKEAVIEEKVLGFVLVDHLNDKQKDESYQIAKKAYKVYRKAHLANVYCSQACCEIM